MPKPLRAKPRIDLSPSKLRKLADEELMELVCRNEAVAFEVVMERHVDAAFSLAYRMIGRRAARRGRRAGGVAVAVAYRRSL